MSKKLRIEDLVGAVQEDAEIAEIENSNKNTNNASKEEIDKLDNTLKKMKLKKIEVSQKVSQKHIEKLERQENNILIKDDLKRWLPAIKKNREAEHLDFTDNVKNDEFRMQTNANSKKNDKNKAANAQDKIMQKLQEINIDNEDNLKKREYKQIERLDSQKRDNKLDDLIQHKNLM